MKKIFFIVTAFITMSAVAQNVGIGELVPADMRLQVKRADSAILMLHNSTVSGKTGLFFKMGTNYSGSIATIGSGATFRLGMFTFGGSTPASLLERFSITDGGNVGVGTISPTERFSVLTATNSLGISHTDGTIKVGTYVGSAGGSFGTVSNHPLNFITNNSAPQLTLLPNGKLGIGTTNPLSMLEIKPGFGSADIELNAQVAGGDNAVLRLNRNGSSMYSVIRFKNLGINNWDMGTQGDDNFKLKYVPTNATIIDVDDATRKIGLLTNDFTESVNIGGNLQVTGTVISNGSGAGLAARDRSLANYNGWTWYADGGKMKLYRYTVGGDLLTVDAAGNLGVGTTSPGFKLDVAGRIRLRNDGANTSGIWFDNNLNVPTSFVGQYTPTKFGVYGSTGWQFSVDGNDGTVYCGSPNLDGEDLTKGAGYKLRVYGKVIAEEVRVQLKAAWPDYVFSKNYKLRSLNEVEAYISANNHLPNLPAAAEVEKSGIALGEMQTKMMEKIEELTLYIIDQEKRLKIIEDENIKVKEQLAKTNK